jgi:hypothetical protein
MLGVYGFKTKKSLKEATGREFADVVVETSLFGPEFKGDGTYAVVGPDAYTARNWYANVTVVRGKIAKVT